VEITGERWLKIGCGGLTEGRPSSSSGTVMADNGDDGITSSWAVSM